jgi:predicted alpha/beta hydrolase family esterase
MTPLAVIFMGINRSKDEFNTAPSIHTYIESSYDSMYVSLTLDDLQTTKKIQQRLKTILAEIQERGIPHFVLAHSFGCIFALYSLAEFQNPGIQFLCIDPTTQFTRGYAEHISPALAEFLDATPKPQINSVYVLSYAPKEPMTEKKKNYIRKRNAGIMALFSETTEIKLKYILKESGKNPHDVHLNHPEGIINSIKTS